MTNVQDWIVAAVGRATHEVFSTMLGSEITQADVSVDCVTSEAGDGVVSLIGLAGTWAGMGSVSCSPSLACRICSQMLMTDSSCVDEEVLDAVAELTNIIIGGVKTDLEQHLGPLGLSIPTVVFGRNFRTKTAGSTQWIVIQFFWDTDQLTVRMCLEPNPIADHADHRPACALDV